MQDNAIVLDVSLLVPPEPMQAILKALSCLPQGHYLHVIHRRKPVPLFDILAQQSFTWRYQEVSEDEHYLDIWPIKEHQLSAFFEQKE